MSLLPNAVELPHRIQELRCEMGTRHVAAALGAESESQIDFSARGDRAGEIEFRADQRRATQAFQDAARLRRSGRTAATALDLRSALCPELGFLGRHFPEVQRL